MSGPELPYEISSSKETTKIVDDLLLHLNEMQLHDNKPTSRNIVASSDLATYPSAGIDSGGAIAQGFRRPSNHEPHISRLQTQTRFFTHLSCDLETDITKPTPRKIVVSSDLAPDPPASLGY